MSGKGTIGGIGEGGTVTRRFGQPLSSGLLAVVLTFGLVVSGCSGGNSGIQASPPSQNATSSSSAVSDALTSTSTAGSRDAAVIAGYEAHWAAWYAAVQAANASLPSISATTTGNLLAHTLQEIQAMQSSGERIKGDPGVPPIEFRQPRVARFESDTTAIVGDCVLDHTVRYDAAGHPIGETQPTFFSVTATVVYEQGAWKVAALQLGKNGCRA